MKNENLKIKEYEFGASKLPDYPSDAGYTAEMLKAVFDARSDKEIKEKHNALCDVTTEISEALEVHKESPEAHAKLLEDVREELSVFVKNTDYATEDKAGVVKINPNLGQSGLYVTSDGVLKVFEADNVDIEAGQPMAVITAGNFRYAMEVLGPAIKNGDGEVSLKQAAWKDEAANSATGKGAAAFGGYNKADAKCAMAVNYNNEVKAPNAFAANAANKISEEAEGSFVAGKNNEAKGVFQAVFGTYSKVEANDAFVVGNGQNENGRQNAFKVDKAGNAETKTLKVENSVTTKSVVAREKSYVGCGVITEKEPNFAQNIVEGQGAAAFGGNNKIYGRNGFTLMTANVIPEDCESVFIAGHANTAAASHQAIFGTYAEPSASDVFVIGNGNKDGRKNAFSVDRYGDVKFGGTKITLGNTVITETLVKELSEIESLKQRIAELELHISRESE